MNDRVEGLLRQGILRSEPDAVHGARPMLEKARIFLAAAQRETEATPAVSFANAYASVRLAVTGLMWSMGLRVADRGREHEHVAAFGRGAIRTTRDLDLAELDRMRRQRNGIEYEPGRLATPAAARKACAYASRLLDTIDKMIPPAS